MSRLPAHKGELLSIAEAERRLRVRHGKARELIAQGHLEAIRVGERERVTVASLERYLGITPAVPADLTALIDQRIARVIGADGGRVATYLEPVVYTRRD